MYPALDVAVAEYLADERSAGRPVSNKQLIAKALEVAHTSNIPATFKATSMWLKRWKKRQNVCLRFATNDSQKIPTDYHDILQQFRTDIVKLRIQHSYSTKEMYNMDQTMCRFDMAPNRTNNTVGSKTVRIVTTKASKKGFTVALAANGAGEKLPALIIFKERGGKLGPRVSKLLTIPPNVKVMATRNGWMTAEMYHWWLENIYGCDMTTRRLLLVDNYKAHTTELSMATVESKCNSDIVLIPAGCTPLVQPMDVSVNRPFKALMREQWVTWFSTHNLHTKHGNLKQPTRQDVINWVSKAWESVKMETIVESFLLCGITPQVDGSENHKMFSHVPHVIVEQMEETGMEDGDDDVSDKESDSDDDGMVTGDDFDGFDSDPERDPFDSD